MAELRSLIFPHEFDREGTLADVEYRFWRLLPVRYLHTSIPYVCSIGGNLILSDVVLLKSPS